MTEESKEKYKIVFRGGLVANMSEQQVRENLKARLKFSDAALDKLFSGRPMVLKTDLDKATAERYSKALWQAGARSKIESMVVAPAIEVARQTAPQPAARPQMVCPKCDLEQPEAEICIGCGVVIAKARERLEHTGPAGPEPPPAEPAGASQSPPPNEAPLPDEGVVTWPVIRALAGTRPWVRLVAVLMLLGSGLGLAGSLMVLVTGGRAGMGAAGPTAVVQILMFVLYVIPAWFLLKYAGAIGAFLTGGTVEQLETALGYQKSFWKFVGILSLVMIVLAVLGIVAAILLPGLVGR
jgi:hypothetical protein